MKLSFEKARNENLSMLSNSATITKVFLIFRKAIEKKIANPVAFMIVLFMLTFLQISIFTNAAEKTNEILSFSVSGRVLDAQGKPIEGVTVTVKGSTIGTTTDAEGKYSIEAAKASDILVFSYIGFASKEVAIDGRNSIDVQLVEDVQSLNNVVVVGYGTQKKINLTGSVATVSNSVLKNRTVTQSSQLLQGAASGVSVMQGSGLPGSDQGNIVIRGLGTFSGAGNNPLVLVDGVPSSLNSVSPNDIASISVLKDAASASIYGSRGANGVILITTKVGIEGKPRISYSVYVGKQEATQLPEYVDSWTYAEMLNEANHNLGLGDVYTQEQIEKFKSGEDLDNYPNKHHVYDLFHSGNGLQVKHNLSVSGSQGATKYLFSAGYLNQKGIIEKTNYQRYDFRLNLDTKVRSNLTLSLKLAANFSDQNLPAMMNTENSPGGFDAILRAATEANATEPGEKSDGTYGTHMGHPTASAGLNSASFQENRNNYFMNNFSFVWKIIPSLQLTSRLGYDLNYARGDNFASILSWDNQTVVQGPSKLQVNTSNNKNLTWDTYLDYEKTFGDNYFHALGGFSHIKNYYESLGAYRENSPSVVLHVINAFGTTNQTNSGTASETKLNSLFGRINYRFKDRYLLEANLRYDGSSRFSEKTRFGLFPSVSAGWIVSKESFFNVPWIQNLKIRSSYGTLGNQEIGTYPYQRTLNLNQPYPFGEQEVLYPGIALTTLPFQNITWETVTAFNQGLDIDMFKGKIGLTIDYYNRKTSDILQSMTVSRVLGMNVSAQNAGEVRNRGFDFELNYNVAIKDFSISIQPNFSINHNEVVSLGGVDKDINRGLFIGKPIGAIYGYETEGLFVDQHDIDNYPVQNYIASPGLIKYRDISGPDGVPDGIISADYDRTVLSTTNPKFSYGIGIQSNYKGFDFFVQFQGLAGFEKQLSGIQLALFNNGNIQQWQVDNRWSPENPNPGAKYPKLIPLSSSPEVPFGNTSEYWLRDASFLRMKTIQLGYTIPSKLLNRFSINQFRIYISGQNVFTIDKYYAGWDPEMTTGGYANSSYYPPTRLWIAGVNINF